VLAADVRNPHLLSRVRGRVDAVLCNPPYVPIATEVEPEVLADPPEAVFAGPDGLGLMPSVLSRAAELLRPGGVFVLEHSETHVGGVLELFAADGRWDDVADHADLAGRPRFATARRVDRPSTAN
jgi:release factor glutamine methyltransferase